MIRKAFSISTVIIIILLFSFAVNGTYTLLTATPISQETIELSQQFKLMSETEKAELLKRWREKVDEMTPRQQFTIAELLLHDESSDVVKDRKEAVYWLVKSAQQGLPEAQYWLAVWCSSDTTIFDLGDTIERTPENAFYWFNKSAQAGYAPSYGSLGRLYEYGIGVEKNEKLAKYWRTHGYVETGNFSDLEAINSLLTRGELLIALVERFLRVALWIN